MQGIGQRKCLALCLVGHFKIFQRFSIPTPSRASIQQNHKSAANKGRNELF